MSNKEHTISMGTVIAFGFILLGIMNLFASRHYHKTTFSTTSRFPGFLFISIGLIILIIRAVRKNRI